MDTWIGGWMDRQKNGCKGCVDDGNVDEWTDGQEGG